MQVVRSGEDPAKYYVAVVQIKEVTPAYRVPTGSVVGGATTVERQVDDAFTVSLRDKTMEGAARRAVFQLETLISGVGQEVDASDPLVLNKAEWQVAE